jgi:hypothetical protein
MNEPNQPADVTRRRFVRATGLVAGTLALGTTTTGTVAADASNNPAKPGRIYAGGRLFATADVADLPPPQGNNAHSYDELYVFEGDVADGQVPVSEAAPGEQDFNGGRWSVTRVEWTIDNPPLVTSAAAAHDNSDDIHVIEEGARYFECPLIPLGD